MGAQGLELLSAASIGVSKAAEGEKTLNLCGKDAIVGSIISPRSVQIPTPKEENVKHLNYNDRIIGNNVKVEGNKLYITDETPRRLDILCGRGGKSNHHPGNKRFRQLIRNMKSMYKDTETKTMKTDLSRKIVEYVCTHGGRFLKKDAKSNRYYLLSKEDARKKTSQ